MLLWDIDQLRYLGSVACEGVVYCLSWDPTGNYVAVGTSRGLLQIIDTSNMRVVASVDVHDDVTFRVAWAPDGSDIVCSSRGGSVAVVRAAQALTGAGEASIMRRLSHPEVRTYYVIAII